MVTPDSTMKDTDGILYSSSQWSEDGYGSQRAVVQVDEPHAAVKVILPWRRRDDNPHQKDIRVYDALGSRVTNVVRGAINREYGEIIFEPASGPGEYFIYFMPCSGPSLFADSVYFSWEETAAPAWLDSIQVNEAFPTARLLRFEARGEFERRDPMELVATQEEVASLLESHPGAPYMLFPEDRRFPIRMTADLPYSWIRSGLVDHFEGQAHPGEEFAFQLGVFACRETIDDITFSAGDLCEPGGTVISAAAVRCINTGGTDWEGREFTKTVRVEQGQVRALWVLVTVPDDAPAGTYTSELVLQPTSGRTPLPPFQLRLELVVNGDPLPEHGCLDAWRQSRLAWLDSSKGHEDTVMAPYLPLQMEGNTIRMLGRSVRFNTLGFPESLVSNGRELLAEPVSFTVEPFRFFPTSSMTVQAGAARICREWHLEGDGLRMGVSVQVDFDGCVEYRVELRADHPLHTGEISLNLALDSANTTYFMGLGVRGGKAPWQVDWHWDIDRITNMLWVGTAQAGLHLNLMHSQDLWPQSYNYRSWGTPSSWDHVNAGKVSFHRGARITRIQATAGPRDWQAGEVEEFRFRLLVTPFKPLDQKQWSYRYSSKTALHLPDPEDGPAQGLTIAHLHHGAAGINPWINYPFLTLDAIRDYRRRLLECGYKGVDIYYTLREISSHISEMWALRSLGDEIFTGGVTRSHQKDPESCDEQQVKLYRQGGGYAWLQEHLVDGYERAWLHAYEDGEVDAAIATQGLSRLHNFYIEGMDLLMKVTGCGGLYIDGLAFGRSILQRVARVMASNRPDYRIKFHSGNNYDFSDWHCNVLAQYTEHLPYITDLWIGEGFDYNLPPDYWLVEISGIPFGLTSEMLDYEHGGNPWRGMLYAMDGRMHPCAPSLWKLWDSFGIQDARMIGYWEDVCPVRTGREDILATVYSRPGCALVALASWCAEPTRVRLAIDWDALGIDPNRAALSAPEIPSFQPSAQFKPEDEILVEAGQGWLLVISN